MENPVLTKLRAGGCVGAMWVSLGSPTIAELMVEPGCDAILFDLQHGLWTRPTLEAAIGMTRSKAVPLVRPQDDSYSAIGNALDSGALGIIVPMVESAEQAKRIVAAAKYPPDGRRSFGGIRPALDWKAVVPKTNAAIFVAAMIETKAGLENAAAIAAVPGIDMLFIGPSDLSLATGTFPDLGANHEAAIQSILQAAKKAGKSCGLFTPNVTLAMDRRLQGFQFVVLTYDQDLLEAPSKAAIRRYADGQGKDLIKDAVALVTGCNRGIGPETVRALLKAGAKKIYVGARKPDGLKRLVAEAPDRLQPFEIDVTSKEQIAAAARMAKDVTLLINNAGVNFNTPLMAIESMDNARREMEVNYFGTLAMCRAFQPILKANGGGAIVTMLSILSYVNLPLMGSLCASKAALLSLTQALRAELKAQGTHVMGVAPGAVDTDMTAGVNVPKIQPSYVAAAIVDGLRRRADEIYPGDMAAGVFYGLSGDPKAVEREFANYLPAARV
ncbi:MAG TPA: SDR family oxidoreductase [Dongiaceae bacterium]|jgi:2-keto-3-deoxy-L-rhamnonate aldolase RhmA/NAD(P)-dependent dehydrogenase (short-subunit alcohol dehydrogenase family)|nr:SDR family oxidoreductase [Dongiaceae bacterium]